MEAIAGISSILQLINSVAKVSKRLNELRESYNNVALNTTLVASQLSTIRAALEALYEWRANDKDTTVPSRQLDKDLGMSLSCCAILISVIDGKLDESGYMPGLKQKIRYLWLENILKEYISNLEGQVRALQLLLTIFQCRTETEKRQKLANEESRTIIEQVRAETASLALDNMEFQDAASVLSLDPSVIFDIDPILMNSPAYKRVYGAARLRLPTVVSQAAFPLPTPFPGEMLHPPPLPSRPTRELTQQSQDRSNVWDYCRGGKEDKIVDEMILVESSNVFELPGENGTAVPLKNEKSHTAASLGDETSHAMSRKGSKELERHSKSQSNDSSLDLSRRESLREDIQRPTSTHSSLYDCSITAVSKGQSTRTSSPYSCVSCRNIGTTKEVSENDKLEAEIHDLIRSSPQPESGSNRVRESITGKGLNMKILDQSQPIPVTARFDTLDESQFHPPKDVLPHFPESTTVKQQTQNKELTTSSTALVDDLVRLEVVDLKSVETSRSNAGLGLRHINTRETSDLESQESKKSCSNMLDPLKLVIPIRPSSSQSPPAVVFTSSAEPRQPESEQSTLSSNTPSFVHDATSTTSSSEAPEDSTILSLQKSTSNTTATSINTHEPVLDRDQPHSDIRRLQNELAAAKVRGDNRAVQDSLQRSIEVTRHKYLTGPSAKDNNAPAIFPSPSRGRARSKIIRFPSLSGSAKGAALGAFAASGDTLSVQNILKEKVNVDSRSDNFKTPLMRAAMNGHIECIKLLKQSGADEFAVDARGRTVLHIAVASNRLAVVEWLLEAYPPPKLDALKHRPSLLFRATDVVKGVRSQKNLRETSDAGGLKPLHVAAELDKGGMVETLIAAGVDIESKDNWGRTPLHRAIISTRRDSFDTLFRSGANLAAVDANSISPLHLAAQAGQVDTIDFLLENGAIRWDFDAHGDQPIHSAVRGGNPFAIEALAMTRTDIEKRTKSGETPLHLACLKKDVELAKYLLTKLVDINPWSAPSSGVLQVLSKTRIKGSLMTPLHYACCFHDFEMAVLLLDHEALVNAPTPEGATALMMAVETEDTNMVNLLLQRGGAKVNAKIPGSLVTALHLAARRGDLETVQQLCRHRADTGARTSGNGGRNPMVESLKCPDKKKGQAVEDYIRIIVMNKILNNARARKSQARPPEYQARPSESYQPYHSSPGAQIAPHINPISYAPWAGSQHGYPQNQGYVVQQAQGQNLQYFHSDFDVPDDALPAYEPGPSAPARLANQAPVHRENYA